MLWKRFSCWRHKCDICEKRSFIQYEVGVGYWVCKNPGCLHDASVLCAIDLKAWQEEQAYDKRFQ